MKIEDRIIKLLSSGPLETKDLVRLAKQEANATTQGAYKAIRKLRESEILTLHEKTAGLSIAWVEEELAEFQRMASAYRVRAKAYSFLHLKPGRHITFKFRTLREMHLFWVQAFLILETHCPISVPTYALSPHDWFYMKTAADRVWERRLEQGGRRQGAIITHATPFDKKVIQGRHVKEVEFVFGKNPFAFTERQYMNMIEPWIIEAFIDPRVNQQLLALIRSYQGRLPDKSELVAIENLPGNHLLRISRAPKRARRLISKIKRYFTFT